MTHGREAEPENDAQPDLRQNFNAWVRAGVKMGQTHLYLIRTHRTNSRAAEQQSSRAATGSHGGDSNPACTQTQSPAATTAATTTSAGTPKAAQKAGEDIPPKNHPAGPQGTRHHTEVPVELAGHSAAAAQH
ncbi:hypothetical protein NDU88_008106 [Pleurodeles waltl]|uniref:Uncharacterized protein n=1 Tax=Pleurodeles waltl TaxID=8319 RepID=A0AAV7P2P6_PLEWA|nr:hypothetical protein NDU88_008106 [Pleurodeles waltl]